MANSNDEPGPEIAPNFSDETVDMPNEGALNANTELRKRRSTRIVQAVPLVVTGVDALGRPFRLVRKYGNDGKL